MVSGDFSRSHGSSMKSQVAFLGYTRGFKSQRISTSFQGFSSGSQLASENFRDDSEGFMGCPRAYPRFSMVCLKVFYWDFPKISIFQGNSRRSDKIPGPFQNVSEASLKVLVNLKRCPRGVSVGLIWLQLVSGDFGRIQRNSRGSHEAFLGYA